MKSSAALFPKDISDELGVLTERDSQLQHGYLGRNDPVVSNAAFN